MVLLKHEVNKQGLVLEGIRWWPVIHLITCILRVYILNFTWNCLGYRTLRSFQWTQVNLRVLLKRPDITFPSKIFIQNLKSQVAKLENLFLCWHGKDNLGPKRQFQQAYWPGKPPRRISPVHLDKVFQEAIVAIMHMLSLMYLIQINKSLMYFFSINILSGALSVTQPFYKTKCMGFYNFGAKIDFKHEEGMKIASQMWMKIITVSFDVILLSFALSRRRRRRRRSRRRSISNHGGCFVQRIISLADFYSQKVKLNSAVIPSVLSKDTLTVQCKVIKIFVLKTN